MGKKWNRACGLALMPSDLSNEVVYIDYYKRLQEIAVNRFEWLNMPPEIDVRFLELSLFSTGMAIFFRDEVVDQFVAIRTMIGGNLNIYNVPKERKAYATNGYNRELSDKDSVIIFNNYLREPSFSTIQFFAARLANIERTIDVNLNAQKTPVLIKTSESQRLTMKNVYNQYDGNSPVIYGDKRAGLEDSITVFKTDAPFLADKLQLIKHQYWDEAMTYLGIENANTDKKERLITNEVDSGLGSVKANRAVFLNAREQACDRINKMFGLNISVKFKDELNEGGVSYE